MKRRDWLGSTGVFLLLSGLGGARAAAALTLDELSNAEVSKGLHAALEKGALAAVGQLGAADGFLGNARVRIALPGRLQDAAQLLRTLGQGDKVDELVVAMNRAAEAAVPMAKDLLLGAIQSMSVSDAKAIVQGGDTSITDFFVSKTRSQLADRFLPEVTKATEHVGLADKYNQVAGKAAQLGLIGQDDANVQRYVTGKALDGLFLIISDEEKKIRQNPVAAGNALLDKVFGSLH